MKECAPGAPFYRGGGEPKRWGGEELRATALVAIEERNETIKLIVCSGRNVQLKVLRRARG